MKRMMHFYAFPDIRVIDRVKVQSIYGIKANMKVLYIGSTYCAQVL